MIYVDPTTGRVFNFDLEGACNFLNYSDDKGASWTTNPLACGNIVVDHKTIVTARPTSLPTVGYPNVVYWCSNRVADSTCGRSLDGGITWTATGTPAYTGYDPAAGGLCGGLTGHLAADPDGRIFLPKGHCGHPWVAISDDEGTTWTRVQVSNVSATEGREPRCAAGAPDRRHPRGLTFDPSPTRRAEPGRAVPVRAAPASSG